MEEQSKIGTAESDYETDIPEDFFDDFSNTEFMAGLDVIDTWDDEDSKETNNTSEIYLNKIELIQNTNNLQKNSENGRNSPVKTISIFENENKPIKNLLNTKKVSYNIQNKVEKQNETNDLKVAQGERKVDTVTEKLASLRKNVDKSYKIKSIYKSNNEKTKERNDIRMTVDKSMYQKVMDEKKNVKAIIEKSLLLSKIEVSQTETTKRKSPIKFEKENRTINRDSLQSHERHKRKRKSVTPDFVKRARKNRAQHYPKRSNSKSPRKRPKSRDYDRSPRKSHSARRSRTRTPRKSRSLSRSRSCRSRTPSRQLKSTKRDSPTTKRSLTFLEELAQKFALQGKSFPVHQEHTGPVQYIETFHYNTAYNYNGHMQPSNLHRICEPNNPNQSQHNYNPYNLNGYQQYNHEWNQMYTQSQLTMNIPYQNENISQCPLNNLIQPSITNASCETNEIRSTDEAIQVSKIGLVNLPFPLEVDTEEIGLSKTEDMIQSSRKIGLADMLAEKYLRPTSKIDTITSKQKVIEQCKLTIQLINQDNQLFKLRFLHTKTFLSKMNGCMNISPLYFARNLPFLATSSDRKSTRKKLQHNFEMLTPLATGIVQNLGIDIFKVTSKLKMKDVVDKIAQQKKTIQSYDIQFLIPSTNEEAIQTEEMECDWCALRNAKAYKDVSVETDQTNNEIIVKTLKMYDDSIIKSMTFLNQSQRFALQYFVRMIEQPDTICANDMQQLHRIILNLPKNSLTVSSLSSQSQVPRILQKDSLSNKRADWHANNFPKRY